MPASNQGKIILIVEDEEKNMKLIADVLQLAGYRILKAVNGEEAIAHIQIQDPDLVVADICMSDVNGWELGFWISENKKDIKIPIIFLSSLISEEGPVKPGEFGECYMPKPFVAQRLIKKIEELLTVTKEA